MKFKCPECGEKMSVNEETHVCECGKELSLTEANELFEDSKLIAFLDDDEGVIAEGKDDDDDVNINVKVDTDSDDDDSDDDDDDSDDDDKKPNFDKKKKGDDDSDDDDDEGKEPGKPGKDEKIEEGVDPKTGKAKTKGNTPADEKTPEGGNVEGKTKPKKAKAPAGGKAKAEGADVDDPEDGSGKKQVVPESFDMSDAVAALTDGEELSEEYKDKATLIFESAVGARVKAEVDAVTATLEEQYVEKLEEEKTTISAELDTYMENVVDEWKQENEVALSTNLQIESMQSFIEGMKSLFETHYIEVPEGRYDVLEGLAAKVEELEGKLDEEVKKNVGLHKDLKESKRKDIIAAVSEGLADTQKEKLMALVEEVEETDLEKFEAKVTSLKESFFKKGTSEGKELNEEVITSDGSDKGSNDLIARAVEHLKAPH